MREVKYLTENSPSLTASAKRRRRAADERATEARKRHHFKCAANFPELEARAPQQSLGAVGDGSMGHARSHGTRIALFSSVKLTRYAPLTRCLKTAVDIGMLVADTGLGDTPYQVKCSMGRTDWYAADEIYSLITTEVSSRFVGPACALHTFQGAHRNLSRQAIAPKRTAAAHDMAGARLGAGGAGALLREQLRAHVAAPADFATAASTARSTLRAGSPACKAVCVCPARTPALSELLPTPASAPRAGGIRPCVYVYCKRVCVRQCDVRVVMIRRS